MKEYREDGVKVIEYSFEDWQDGTISGLWKPGKEEVKNNGGQETYYCYLPVDQYQLIEEKRKALYWDKVDKQFTNLKKEFLDQYKQSGNPDQFLQSELKRYEALFFPEKLPLRGIPTNDYFPIEGLPIHSINIVEYRKLYKKLILRGKREYHYTNSPKCRVQFSSGDYHLITVEAFAKYLTWLQNFDPNSIIMEEINIEVLKPHMAKNDLDFYYNVDNIRNQDLVFATFDYFDSGERKGLMKPLDFLNLLWEQKKEIKENIQKPHTAYNKLMSLPISEEFRHILFGFILKWAGGYPIHFGNQHDNSTYRLIEREFRKFPGDTPEKEFCHKDCDRYIHRKQVEKEMEDYINGRLTNTNSHSSAELTESPFQLRKKKGARIDLIRIFNALYELRLIELSDGQLPTKGYFMEQIGRLLNVDLSKYDTDLSQALNQSSLETNTEVFHKMIKIISDQQTGKN